MMQKPTSNVIHCDWHSHFMHLAAAAEQRCHSGETLCLSLSAEQSDFIRFNIGKVRQIGYVVQCTLTLRLIEGQRQAYLTLTLAGDTDADMDALAEAMATLRDSVRDMEDDPHLLFATSPWQHTELRRGELPEAHDLVGVVARCAQGLDFVGFYAGGVSMRGFSSTCGTRGWYEIVNFHFSWSLYDSSGRAIKATYQGDQWNEAMFAHKLEQSAQRLPFLQLAPYTLKPGRYRAYLTPSALAELLETLAWTSFSARAHANASSPLQQLYAGKVALDPRVTISEDLGLGITPTFNEDGYRRETVPLIHAGRGIGWLTNARSAREYGGHPNGALASEMPAALSMLGGDLADSEVLTALDTGLYVGNLWYVNFSDWLHCRLTGTTRFATFWVNNGKIVAPVETMRFDESLYQLLGDQLERLDATPTLLLNDTTWDKRALGGMHLPGLLARSFALTL